jgi:hypothetical protein
VTEDAHALIANAELLDLTRIEAASAPPELVAGHVARFNAFLG